MGTDTVSLIRSASFSGKIVYMDLDVYERLIGPSFFRYTCFRWAKLYRKDLLHRYKVTKKKRTRKKYSKFIVNKAREFMKKGINENAKNLEG